MAEFTTLRFEKLALGAVILGGIAALIFGFPYISKSIRGPLELKPRTIQTPQEQELAADTELRTKDTDQDGLHDYDEIYVWRTSAYLPDTDSDGYSDKTEIDSGNDPNCPSGRTCPRALVETPLEGTASAEASGSVSASPDSFIPPQTAAELFGSASDFGNLSAILTSLPPDEIRALLIQYGVSKETVDALPDSTLVELYRQSIEQAVTQVREQSEQATEEGDSGQ